MKTLALSLALLSGTAAMAASTNAPEVELSALADGVWLHTTYQTLADGARFPSNGLVVRDEAGLTLVDTAWGEAETAMLLKVIAAEIGQPVTRAVVTHFHDDRTSGTDLLESQGVEVYAHPLTRSLTLAHNSPVPDRVLESLTERGGTQTLGRLEIVYPGAGHAPDNVLVWLAEQGILFGGCAIRAQAAESAGNTADADLESWVVAMEFLKRRYGSAKMVVPGHGRPGGTELMDHTARVVRAAQ